MFWLLWASPLNVIVYLWWWRSDPRVYSLTEISWVWMCFSSSFSCTPPAQDMSQKRNVYQKFRCTLIPLSRIWKLNKTSKSEKKRRWWQWAKMRLKVRIQFFFIIIIIIIIDNNNNIYCYRNRISSTTTSVLMCPRQFFAGNEGFFRHLQKLHWLHKGWYLGHFRQLQKSL